MLEESINTDKLPKHIAIIMDGNGRWAIEKGLNRVQGHKNGVKAVREVTEAAAELGISFLTLYAFSTENWNRPKEEVDALMELLVETIKNEISTLNKNNIRLQAIGDLLSLPINCQKNLQEAIDHTSINDGMVLNLALSYSARWEIVEAMKQLATELQENEIDISEINAERISSKLSTKNIPDPELLIRTSGETRVSNFLLWQIAYAELYFTPTLWPDFRKEHFYKAVSDFQNRERRFGKTSEQLKKL